MAVFYPETPEQNRQIVEWARREIGGEALFGKEDEAQAVAVVRGGGIVAAIIYYNFRGTDCEVAFAASTPRWATKETIGVLLMHPFDQFGCRRVTAVTKTKNKRARRFMEGIGFKHEGTLRDAFFPHNAQIYGLTSRDYYASKFYRAVAPEKRPDREPVAIPENPPRLCLIGANAA